MNCKVCGDPAHEYCSNDSKGYYVLGHPKFFGAVIGKCERCNSYIGSAEGVCTSSICTGSPLISTKGEEQPS